MDRASMILAYVSRIITLNDLFLFFLFVKEEKNLPEPKNHPGMTRVTPDDEKDTQGPRSLGVRDSMPVYRPRYYRHRLPAKKNL